MILRGWCNIDFLVFGLDLGFRLLGFAILVSFGTVLGFVF